MYFRTIIVLVMSVLLWNCKNDKAGNEAATDSHMHDHSMVGGDNNVQPPLFNEIMAVHDEIMPRMKDIEDLKAQLRLKIDSIEVNMPDSKYKADFRFALAELNRADDMMTDWMHHFKESYDTISAPAGKNDFLEYERAKIEQIKGKMETSIKIASQTLATTPLK